MLAHEHLEKVTGAIQAEEQRIPAVDDKLLIYEALVDLLVQNQTEASNCEAFAFVEKAKSRSLTDLLAFRAYALPATQPGRSKLADQVRQLREELNWYYRQIDLQEMRAEDRSLTEVEALRRYSRQQENRLIRTLSQLQQTDQEFTSVQEALSVDVDALRSTLPGDTCLLEYYVAKGTVYAMVVDHERIAIVPVTLSSTVEELRGLLANSLSRSSFSATGPTTNHGVSFHYLELLHAELVEPLIPLLTGQRLLVVPHGSLFYLPFHALHSNGRLLSDLYMVSYAPSATAYHLAQLRQFRPAVDGGTFVLTSPDTQSSNLASRLATALPGATVLEGDANEVFLGDSESRARVVHVLTRGQLRHDNPMFSTVELGRGPVHLFDLFQLRLNADLVTVSGCAPSLQAGGKGNEIVGLIRGLLYAGARSVLTTLWDVDDDTWATFAESFYRRVGKGESFESAIRESVVSLRRMHEDPRHWAPFVLFGDGR
jgi:CHAT domain-containing protein